MPGRKYSPDNYRYGFNGKENDNEVKGDGDQEDYGMRVYDPRLGRFLSVDPLTRKYAMLTPYQFSSNSPIKNIDLDGLEGTAGDNTFFGNIADAVVGFFVQSWNSITGTSSKIEKVAEDKVGEQVDKVAVPTLNKVADAKEFVDNSVGYSSVGATVRVGNIVLFAGKTTNQDDHVNKDGKNEQQDETELHYAGQDNTVTTKQGPVETKIDLSNGTIKETQVSGDVVNKDGASAGVVVGTNTNSSGKTTTTVGVSLTVGVKSKFLDISVDAQVGRTTDLISNKKHEDTQQDSAGQSNGSTQQGSTSSPQEGSSSQPPPKDQ